MRRFALLAAAAGFAASAAMAQEGWSLVTLMQEMARVKSAEATFTESKTIRMLNAPLQDSGTLSYAAPDTIRKTTISPVHEDFELRQSVVTLTDAKGEHRFTLRQSPAIGGLTEAVRGTLAGDLAGLQRYYEMSFSGPRGGWQLVLRPKDAGLRRFVAWIAIRGNDDRISEIETENADGTHSDMRISETSVAR